MLKTAAAQIASVIRSRRGRRNLRVLGIFFLVLAVMIIVYSVTFHVLMLREGKEYSWLTGFYWTLTVMSTLGFGDITFDNDLGRLFSMVVLLSGMVFLLVLLPFTFIEFFYEPWMNAQATARTPRQLPPVTNATMSRPFEFVLLDRPGLALRADPEAFAEHFEAASEEEVIVFPNLGRDAIMVVPCPLAAPSSYGHLAAFVREAPDSQWHALWRSVGEAMAHRPDLLQWLKDLAKGPELCAVNQQTGPAMVG